MPHNGFIYEAWMDMMDNSGHCLKDDSKNIKQEMLHHLKDHQVECTRTHGDVKRKWIENEDDSDQNDEKKSKTETEEIPAHRIDNLERLMGFCQGKLERLEESSKEMRENQENTTTNLQELKYRNNHKFLENELINLKKFIIKERMVSKNVKKVKEYIKNIVKIMKKV